MFSDYLNKQFYSFIDSLKLSSLKKKKHKAINERFNLIGSIEISKENLNKEIVLYNLLVNQTKPLNGLYVHLNLIDYPNKEKDLELSLQSLLLKFSDIIIVKWHKYPSEFNVLSVYPFHSVDHVYLFDQYTEYDNDTVNYFFENRKDRVIQNLSSDNFHKKRIHKNSIFLYNLNDDSYECKERENIKIPCIENMVKKDIFIPAFTIDEKFNIDALHRFYNNHIELFNIVNSFKNEYNVEITEKNYNLYKEKGLEMDLYRILHNSDIKEAWQRVFPGYDFSLYGNINIQGILNSSIEVASIGYNFPELLIENLNTIRHKIIGKIDKITLLENSHHYQLSMNSNVRDVLALRMQNINYLNNMTNQYFERTWPDRDEKPYYGYHMYEDSVKYLYDNCEQDYLIIFNTKVILKSELLYDENDVYCEYGDYIKIFNMKKLKELEIKFDSFDQFIKELKEKGIKITKLEMDAKTITLPIDFDKYNGVMFIFARLRYRVIQKYLLDHGVSLVYDKFWNSR